ncbi:MAG: 4Fe-4S dicluster domain-containing protein [Elusimicrobia bacterium]|nr:4Fe-4S dicluster domain-containing protein [Elusimicrobiota bacterium]
MSGDRDSRLSRRRFLGLMGASAALAAGCSKPDRGAIASNAKRPRGSTPGLTDSYATTFQEGLDSHGVLVRAREGRPIHLQGNDLHPLSKGKAPMRAIADIMRLYDPDRLRQPLADGRPASWTACVESLLSMLKAAKQNNKGVLLLTGALVSPTARRLVSDLAKTVPGLKHAAWEPALSDSEASALRSCYGSQRRPRLKPELARVVVALEADLLSPDKPSEIAGFASTRAPGSGMSRLYVFEAGMSLTGAKADHRFPWRPSRSAALAFGLARELWSKGVPLPPGFDPALLAPFYLGRFPSEEQIGADILSRLVADLKGARGGALVVAGPSLPAEAHAAVFLLNAMLGAEGRTVDASLSSEPETLANGQGMRRILESAASGAFEAAVFWRANPAYAFPDPDLWQAAVSAIPSKAFIGMHADETARNCGLILAENHWLESWNDFEPQQGLLSLQQPAIGRIFNTQQGEDILLAVLTRLRPPMPSEYRGYLMARWKSSVFPGKAAVSFERFWNACLHDGVFSWPESPKPLRRLEPKAVADASRKACSATEVRDRTTDFELVLAPAASVHDGRYANNGWLQELPHPMTKLSWGNSAAMSPADAERLKLKDGSLVELSINERKAVLPVVVQPGQAPGTLSSCLGYGRRSGSVARGVGMNLYPLLQNGPDLVIGTKVRPAGGSVDLPFIQRHHKLEGREVVQQRASREFLAGTAPIHRHHSMRLIPSQRFQGRKWSMAVDLSRCVGCQSCVLACQSENNVPTVGPERVLKGREMHWIRVDRYYEGDPSRPSVLFEPMFCQQCDDAPCETVCPVAATNHSPEGLNQMAYNRCVGTRYCSNNCPYKVRRFNFFEYAADAPEPMSLAFNPEVTVRPRGVMEKCTFCVQRIDEGKALAKAAGRALKDGDIEPACAAACPAGAIVFGDLNDPKSRVAAAFRDKRGFRVLEELEINPSVTYLAGLTNQNHGN